MVKPSRKKIITAALGVVAAAIAIAAQPVRDAVCFPFLSPAEKKVIGEWQAQMIGGTNVTTIHADHTWTSAGGSCLGADVRPIVGHWRLDGSDVVFSLASHQFGDYPTPDGWRCSIKQLIDTDRRSRAWAIENSAK